MTETTGPSIDETDSLSQGFKSNVRKPLTPREKVYLVVLSALNLALSLFFIFVTPLLLMFVVSYNPDHTPISEDIKVYGVTLGGILPLYFLFNFWSELKRRPLPKLAMYTMFGYISPVILTSTFLLW